MKLIDKVYVCWSCGKTNKTQVAHKGDVVKCPHCKAWN